MVESHGGCAPCHVPGETSEKAGECFLAQLPGGARAVCWGSPSWGSVMPAVQLILWSVASVPAGQCSAGCFVLGCHMRFVSAAKDRAAAVSVSFLEHSGFCKCTAARAKSPLLQSSCYGFFIL